MKANEEVETKEAGGGKVSSLFDCYANTDELRKAAKCVFLATDEDVAQDLADKLNGAANMIDELQDFAIWMTGCGYDFCQHDYFCKKRDELLKA